jgi:hypothetical protein
MASSKAFELAAETLEASTSLDRLESRGTLRILLNQAGLEARTVAGAQLAVAIEKLLPEELEARGVEDARSVAERLSVRVAGVVDESSEQTPEAVFARLGG